MALSNNHLGGTFKSDLLPKSIRLLFSVLLILSGFAALAQVPLSLAGPAPRPRTSASPILRHWMQFQIKAKTQVEASPLPQTPRNKTALQNTKSYQVLLI